MAHLGAEITAVDHSENQIQQAIALSEGRDNIRYLVCPAERTGLPDHVFDAVTALMCFWYFDPQVIVPEIRRLLRPGGIFVKIYMSWLQEDPIAKKSKALIKRLNPKWTAASPAIEDLKKHYFDDPILEKFDAALPFTRESWHGRILSNRGVLASMDGKALAEFEEKHRKFLQNCPEKFTVTHRVFITGYRM
jgi:ubiquinone/menaquinone biosynthesis C-methylase UbiE